MKTNQQNTSILTALTALVLSLVASNIAYAGISGHRNGNAHAGHAHYRETQSHGVANLTNHSGHLFSSDGLTTHASITGNGGNTVIHDGNTGINMQTKEVEHSGSTKQQDNTGYTTASHEGNTHLDSNNDVAEHSSHSVLVDKEHKETTYRDVNTSVITHSDGTKDLNHSVSAERNSVGTPINAHKATTHASTQTNTFTHDGWGIVNAPDGRTSGSHYGNTSVSTDFEGITHLDHSATTFKSIEESIVKIHEGDTHLTQ